MKVTPTLNEVIECTQKSPSRLLSDSVAPPTGACAYVSANETFLMLSLLDAKVYVGRLSRPSTEGTAISRAT